MYIYISACVLVSVSVCLFVCLQPIFSAVVASFFHRFAPFVPTAKAGKAKPRFPGGLHFNGQFSIASPFLSHFSVALLGSSEYEYWWWAYCWEHCEDPRMVRRVPHEYKQVAFESSSWSAGVGISQRYLGIHISLPSNHPSQTHFPTCRLLWIFITVACIWWPN